MSVVASSYLRNIPWALFRLVVFAECTILWNDLAVVHSEIRQQVWYVQLVAQGQIILFRFECYAQEPRKRPKVTNCELFAHHLCLKSSSKVLIGWTVDYVVNPHQCPAVMVAPLLCPKKLVVLRRVKPQLLQSVHALGTRTRCALTVWTRRAIFSVYTPCRRRPAWTLLAAPEKYLRLWVLWDDCLYVHLLELGVLSQAARKRCPQCWQSDRCWVRLVLI